MEQFKKIVVTIGAIISIITYISLGIELYDYSDLSGMRMDNDSSFPTIIILVAIGAIAFAIFVLIKNAGSNTEPDYHKIKSNSVSKIISSSITLFLLLVISHTSFYSFLYDGIEIGFFESIYYSGIYKIIRDHMLIIVSIEIIINIVTYIDANNQINNISYNNYNKTYNSCETNSYNSNNENSYYNNNFKTNNTAYTHTQPGFKNTATFITTDRNTIICSQCNFEQPSDRKICWICQATFEYPKCPHCGALLPKKTKFCGGCGIKLEESIFGTTNPTNTSHKWLCENCKNLRTQSPCEFCGGK